MILTVFVFLLILLLLVLVHEFGHFVVAKKLGIKVEEFGFGFPPRIFSKRIGETLYSINLLPVGGFVKLYGEDEAGAGRLSLPVSSSKYNVSSEKEKIHNTKYIPHATDLERAFFARPARQRAVIVLAGVVMNVLLAVVIYYVFLFISNFKTDVPLLSEHSFFLVNQERRSEVVVVGVAKNSPAENSRITPYSKILAANGAEISSLDQFINITQSKKGEKMVLALQEIVTGKKYEATVIPRVAPPKNHVTL